MNKNHLKNYEFNVEKFFDGAKEDKLFEEISDSLDKGIEEGLAVEAEEDWSLLSQQIVGSEIF